MKNLTLNKKLLLLNAIPLALFIAVGIIAYRSVSSLEENSGWVSHTHKVIGKAQDIVGSAVDMETGMRGYLLAGKEDFLEPYNNGKASFLERVNDLQETVSDNPTQVKRLDTIRTTITEWQSEVVEPAIALRRAIGNSETMNDMAGLVGEARGKTYFDAFRGQVAEFISREEILLHEREAKMEESMKNGGDNAENFAEDLKWVEHTHAVITKARLMLGAAVDMETGLRGYLLAGKEEFLEPYNSGTQVFDDINSELRSTVSDNPAQVALLGEISETIHGWQKDVVEGMIDLRREIGDSKTMDDIADLVGEARGKKYFDAFRGDIADFIAMEAELLVVRDQDMQEAVAFTQSSVLIGCLAAIGVIGMVMLYLNRSLVKPINGIISGLSDNSDQVANSSTYVADSSQKMSEGAATQAAGVEEISSTLEEISSTTEKNAEISGQANGLIQSAGDTIASMTSQMQELTRSMEIMAESSEKTSKIVQTIDEIAFQTNILALNAAVEAARAGDAGAGFAVVADEVRSLAMRAAEAAKDTSVLITESVKSIQESQTIMGKTESSFQGVASQVQDVASIMDQIDQASKEQSLGVSQVNASINEIDSVVQSSAAASEENASSAEELRSQANQLRDYTVELIGLINGLNAAAAKAQSNHVASAAASASAGTFDSAPLKRGTSPFAEASTDAFFSEMN